MRTYNLPNYELLNEKENSDECKNYSVFEDIIDKKLEFPLFPQFSHLIIILNVVLNF